MKTLKEIGFDTPGHSKCENLELEDYLPIYDQLWTPLRNEAVNLLEIGIGQKGSLRMWKEYFLNGNIIGCDVAPEQLYQEYRITTLLADQSNRESMQPVLDLGPFDIIIDDGGHQMYQQIKSLIISWDSVKPGGYYVVEDTCTSYWNQFGGSWPNQHPNTMSFLSNELIHEMNSVFIGMQAWGSSPNSRPIPDFGIKNIFSISFYKSVVILRKNHND